MIGPSETEDKPFKVQGSDSSAKGRPGRKSCDQILKNWRWTLWVTYVLFKSIFKSRLEQKKQQNGQKNLNFQDTNRWKKGTKHLTDLPGAAVCNQGPLELRDPVFILPGGTNKMENGKFHDLVNLEDEKTCPLLW